MKTPLRRLWPAMLIILVASCTERAPVDAESEAPATRAVQDATPAVAPASLPTIAGALPNFAALVETFGPAVVNVSTIGGARAVRGEGPELSPDDPLYDFFRGFGFGEPGGRQPPTARRRLGIRDQRRRIHPDQCPRGRRCSRSVRCARRIGASTGRGWSASMRAPTSRCSRSMRRTCRSSAWATRASLKAGEWVIAIGSPFGFENSVTAGIVSATARSLADAYTPYIQTDVAVNPGNSGGPLFNLQGEVVGINSQIYSRTGGYQGVSFAIPIDVAVNVKDQLVASGRVERGRIGVTIQEVNQALADSFKLPRPRGALVSQVEEDGPADEAGLKAGRRDSRGGRQADRTFQRGTAARRSHQAWQASRLSRSGATSPSVRCA